MASDFGMMATPTEKTEAADQVEDEVLNTIPTLDAEELEEVCGIIKVEVPEGMKGKRRELRRFVTKQLVQNGEKDDNANVLLIHDYINRDIKAEDEPKKK